MIRIAVVDDEIAFIQAYQKKIIELFRNCHVDCKIDTYTNAKLFQKKCKENLYDLIFLDIDMPEVSGIKIASEFRKFNAEVTLVFVSNHDNFVFETFQYNTYRFIRKNKLLSDTAEMIDSFCASLKTQPMYIHLDIDVQKSSLQNISKIMYFYSIRHDTFFCNFQNESFRLAMHTYTMNQLEEQFAEKGFIRVHRSYLVNYRWILQLKGDYVYLKNHEKIPLSRGRNEQVKMIYQKFIREEGIL